MGTSLSGLTPATTFDGLLKVGDNDPLTADLKAISTGDGTDTILSLSNTALHIGGSTTNETTATWVEGFNSNLRLSANSPSIQFKDTSGTAGFMIGVSGASTLFSQSTNADFTAVSYVGRITGGKWNFGSSDTPTATVSIKGSGATSATTSLLVQNSAGSDLLKVTDDGAIDFGLTGLEMVSAVNAGSLRFTSNRHINIGQTSTDYSTFANHTFKTWDGAAYSEIMRITGNTDQFVGIGETTPTARLHVKGSGNDNTTTSLLVQNSDGVDMVKVTDDGILDLGDAGARGEITLGRSTDGAQMGNIYANANGLAIRGYANYNTIMVGRGTNEGVTINNGTTYLGASLAVKGFGATSATTALLVQNSAGTELLKVRDDGATTIDGSLIIDYFTFNGNKITAPIGLKAFMQTGGFAISNDSSGAPASTMAYVKGSGNDNTTTALLVQNSDAEELLKATDDGAVSISANGGNTTIGSSSGAGFIVNSGRANNIRANTSGVAINGYTVGNTALKIYGQGATSATTALLVENSAGTDLLKVRDDGWVDLAGTLNGGSIRANTLQVDSVNFKADGTNDYFQSQFTKNVFGADNTNADASALITMVSTTQGFLPPRMTTTEKNNIAAPAAGLMVYDTDQNQMNYYNGSGWIAF